MSTPGLLCRATVLAIFINMPGINVGQWPATYVADINLDISVQLCQNHSLSVDLCLP